VGYSGVPILAGVDPGDEVNEITQRANGDSGSGELFRTKGRPCGRAFNWYEAEAMKVIGVRVAAERPARR
jgi:hypothetical protein